MSPGSILHQVNSSVELLRDRVDLGLELLLLRSLLQVALLLLYLLHFAQLHRILRRPLQHLQRLRVDPGLIQVLLRHLFFHDCALQVLVPPLLVLDLILHELLHRTDLDVTVLRLKLSLQRHLRHLVSLLLLILVLELFGPLVLGLDPHRVVVQTSVLLLGWILSCPAVPLDFLDVLYK